MIKKNKLQEVFGDKRIVGLAGEKSSGKTNNLVYLIQQFRNINKTPIYVYGMPVEVMNYLKTINIKEISSLKHLVKKRDCILIIDEFQKLRLNDRRYKEQLGDFIDFVYHNNVYVVFSSPNIREFNSVIGGVIEKWILKTVREDLCINGSQLKKIIREYKGKYKSLGCIELPKNELLIINEEEEKVIICDYVKEADNKKTNIDIFIQNIVKEKSGVKVKAMSKLKSEKLLKKC